MAIKFDTFASTGGGGGGAVDSVNGDTGAVIVTLDGVTDQGASTTNAITVGGVTIGTEYSLPTADGANGQALTTNGTGTLSFTTITSDVTSVNTQTGAVVLSGNDLAADHTASNYTPANSNIDGHLSGIDTKLGTLTAGLTYKGSYNATTNSPALTNALQGDLYIISVAGTQFGQAWAVGDHLLINADMGGVIDNSKIDKIDNTDQVTSVNTQTGAVVLSGNDLAADHTASNYTPANSNIDGHLSGIDSKLAAQLEAGDNISTLTNDSGFISDITGESIGDLTDVTITAAANGEVLSYNGSAWVNAAASAGSLSGLSDTTITAAADGEYLRYNGSAWVDASLSVVDDTTPQLGGALDTNGNAITSASNADVTIDPNGTGNISIGADLVPDADATHSIGAENNRYITTYSDLNGAVRFKAKNDQGAAITAGQALYIKGLAGDGTTPTVGLADADDATKMPAFGLAYAGANDQAEVQVVSFGNLGGLNTSAFSVGDTLYVDTTEGALTATKPTGESSQLQNIGRVVRSDNGDGVINVGGAGRSAATPNLDQDKIFLGNASNQAVSTALSAIGLSKFSNDSSFISDVTGESIGDLSDVSITAAATGEVLKYNGSAWVDASVAYSEVTGTPTNVSTFTNDSGYLTDITGESIDDLSDVTITTPTNGQVLSYNGSAWVNSASAGGASALDDLTDVTITAAASGEYLRYSGSAWVDASLSVVDDTTPQLGGNLDTNSNEIVTASNANVILRPNGTGVVQLGGNTNPAEIRLYCESADAHYVGLKSPAHASLSGSQTWTLPTADGTNGQVLQTNGSGSLSFVDQSAGGGGWTYSAITADPANAQAGYHYSCTGTFTITLPTSGVSAGAEIRIKNMGTGTITIDPQTQNIDDSSTDYTLDIQFSAITLVSTGSHWEII